MSVTFKKKCKILRDLYLLQEDELWAQNNPDIMQYVKAYNLGIPLAFCIHENIVEASSEAENLIDEAFEAFLELIEVTEVQISQLETLGDLPGFRHP
jgi:hypothetical protein